MRTVAALAERLAELHRRTVETPLFNPVFQLSLDLSREIESGALDLSAVEALLAELECQGLKGRAGRLRALLQPVGVDANLARFRTLLEQTATDFAAFRARWERPALGTVFTAHPTFLLPPVQADAVAHAAAADDPDSEAVCIVPGDEPPITLEFEHGEAIAAIGRAADARDLLAREVLAAARERWPERWLIAGTSPW